MSVEQVGNALLQKDALEVLPEQVEVVADIHLRPHYDDGNETDGPITQKRSVELPHSMLTRHCARVKSKRYTLAVRRLADGDTASSVLAEFLNILDGLDLGVKRPL